MTVKKLTRKRPSTLNAAKELPSVQLDDLIVPVSPELAQNWLNNNINHNRNITPGLVDKYAAVMKRNEWHLSDPLKFDVNNRLFDGQHRLKAVIRSGKTIPFVVLRGYEPECAQYVDQGKGRKLEHIAQLKGLNYNAHHSAIMRAMLIPNPRFYTFKKTFTHHSVVDLITQYVDYIDFARQAIESKTSPLNKAPFLAVIARAAVHYDVINNQESSEALRLSSAIASLKSGYVAHPEQDSAILRLRDYIISSRNLAASQADRIRLFSLTDYFLWNYMNQKPRKNISLPNDYSYKFTVESLDTINL